MVPCDPVIARAGSSAICTAAGVCVGACMLPGPGPEAVLPVPGVWAAARPRLLPALVPLSAPAEGAAALAAAAAAPDPCIRPAVGGSGGGVHSRLTRTARSLGTSSLGSVLTAAMAPAPRFRPWRTTAGPACCCWPGSTPALLLCSPAHWPGARPGSSLTTTPSTCCPSTYTEGPAAASTPLAAAACWVEAVPVTEPPPGPTTCSCWGAVRGLGPGAV
mmetsp:Transcript_38119/g.84943  ORF Transcript_38119/g.84943 Transcript_38119/m.84943 type:complete len:218 (-) Transcript_38119:388-1041(-)